MSFLIVKLEMALVFFVLTPEVFFDVMANERDFNPDCRDMICTSARGSMNSSCLKNESTVTICLNKSGSACKGVLLMFKETGCEASLLSRTKMRDIKRLCHVTRRKHCYFRKEQAVNDQEELQNMTSGDVEVQEESSRLKIRFKSRNRSIKQYSIVIRRNERGDNGAFDCLLFGVCIAKTVYTTQGSPKLSEEGRNKKRKEKIISAVFCFLLLFLVLEILFCIIFHFMMAKYRRTSSVEVENSTSNPAYQLSPQVLPASYTSPLQDADQESYQPPYQPLVENTRVPGESTGYLTLAVERGEASPVVAADPASYQDLDQSEQRENWYQKNLTQEDEYEEPFYHVPEKTAANEEAPSTSESPRDPMYYVVKELKSATANAPDRVPPEDPVEEPIYYTLEDPREIEEKNTQDEKF